MTDPCEWTEATPDQIAAAAAPLAGNLEALGAFVAMAEDRSQARILATHDLPSLRDFALAVPKLRARILQRESAAVEEWGRWVETLGLLRPQRPPVQRFVG